VRVAASPSPYCGWPLQQQLVLGFVRPGAVGINHCCVLYRAWLQAACSRNARLACSLMAYRVPVICTASLSSRCCMRWHGCMRCTQVFCCILRNTRLACSLMTYRVQVFQSGGDLHCAHEIEVLHAVAWLHALHASVLLHAAQC
jgi:hypothetical protein